MRNNKNLAGKSGVSKVYYKISIC